MANGKVKLAIVGCGGMAHGHLNSYLRIKEKESDKFDFVAMCDPVADRAQKFADEAARAQGSTPKVYTDLDEMLKNEDLDGADICSRHSDHHVNGIACLDAGVNVMIEKPFGVTIKASKLIIEAAERNGKIAATAENIRRGLMVTFLQQSLAKQAIYSQVLGILFKNVTAVSNNLLDSIPRQAIFNVLDIRLQTYLGHGGPQHTTNYSGTLCVECKLSFGLNYATI